MLEGDAQEGHAPIKAKEVGSTVVACPMLNSTNYTVWALRMKVVLRIHKAWSVIDPGEEDNEVKDFLAMGLLYQAIPETLTMQIGEVESSKDLWDAIKARHVGADRVKEARLQTLMTEFDRLKMSELESIDNFAGKLSGLASKSAALGEVINETKLVKKFLKSLPREKYIHIVASLERVLDLKTVGFEDVVGQLKAYEERIKEEDVDDGNQTKVMFVKSSASSGSHGGSKGNWTAKEFKGASGSKQTNRTLHGVKSNSRTSSIVTSPIQSLTQTNIKPRRTDPKLFVIGAINQVTSRLNVRTESKNYKKVILPKAMRMMQPYFYTRPCS